MLKKFKMSKLLTLMLLVTISTSSATTLPADHTDHLKSQTPRDQKLKEQPETQILPEKVLLIEFHKLTLNCTCPPPSSSVAWRKDGRLLLKTTSETQNPHSAKLNPPISYQIDDSDPNQSLLIIEKANSTDIGDYECTQKTQNLHRFIVRAKPRVKFNLSSPYVLSERVRLGSRWAVNCEFASTLYSLNATISLLRCDQTQPEVRHKRNGGNPNLWCGKPSFEALQEETSSWVKDSSSRVVIHKSDTPYKVSFTGDTSGPTGNSTAVSLSINWVRFEDSGYYLCVAQNFRAVSEAVVFLRVVDPYNGIWPLALLLGLALYLFSLVVVFESRRYQAYNLLKLEEKVN